jgi:hypothetical protein
MKRLKRFLAPAKVILVCAMLVWTSAFSCDSAIGILNDAKIGVDGVLPIIALADPALTAPVTVFVTSFDAGVTAVDSYYTAYQAAVAANDGTAPTKKQDLLNALTALKATAAQLLAAAHISDPAKLQLITDIMNAVIAEIVNVANLINPTATVSGHISVTTLPSKTVWRDEHSAFKGRMQAIYNRTTGDAALDAQLHKTAKRF